MFIINQLQNHNMFIYQISLLVLSKVYEDRHFHEASSPAVGRVMKKFILKDFPFFRLWYILAQDHQSEILALCQPNLKSSAHAKSILVQ